MRNTVQRTASPLEQPVKCDRLAGACIADHSDPLFTPGEGRCHGPEVAMPGRYGADFPAAELVQWTDDAAPFLNIGQDTPELDLPGVDQLLNDLHHYMSGIVALREQLAHLTGGAGR